MIRISWLAWMSDFLRYVNSCQNECTNCSYSYNSLKISPHDLGWDVFTLDYHVDSPINTIFTPQAMQQYLQMFNFLWRLKRVEHSLSAAWRGLVTSGRQYCSIPELSKDIRAAQIVVTTMIHFTSQLQYYYLFEASIKFALCSYYYCHLTLWYTMATGFRMLLGRTL